MTEPVYERIHPDPPPHPFAYVFEIREEWWVFDSLPGVFRDQLQPVIGWATDRFGEGAVSLPGAPAHEVASYSPERDSVSYAWSMDSEGSMAFQHEDHALEFRMRWCG